MRRDTQASSPRFAADARAAVMSGGQREGPWPVMKALGGGARVRGLAFPWRTVVCGSLVSMQLSPSLPLHALNET